MGATYDRKLTVPAGVCNVSPCPLFTVIHFPHCRHGQKTLPAEDTSPSEPIRSSSGSFSRCSVDLHSQTPQTNHSLLSGYVEDCCEEAQLMKQGNKGEAQELSALEQRSLLLQITQLSCISQIGCNKPRNILFIFFTQNADAFGRFDDKWDQIRPEVEEIHFQESSVYPAVRRAGCRCDMKILVFSHWILAPFPALGFSKGGTGAEEQRHIIGRPPRGLEHWGMLPINQQRNVSIPSHVPLQHPPPSTPYFCACVFRQQNAEMKSLLCVAQESADTTTTNIEFGKGIGSQQEVILMTRHEQWGAFARVCKAVES